MAAFLVKRLPGPACGASRRHRTLVDIRLVGSAGTTLAAAVPLEAHAGWRVVGEDDVEVRARTQRRDLAARSVGNSKALGKDQDGPSAA